MQSVNLLGYVNNPANGKYYAVLSDGVRDYLQPINQYTGHFISKPHKLEWAHGTGDEVVYISDIRSKGRQFFFSSSDVIR